MCVKILRGYIHQTALALMVDQRGGWGGGKGDSVCAVVDNYYVNVDNTWQHRL